MESRKKWWHAIFISERILGAILSIGYLSRVLHWPYDELLVMVGLFGFSGLYLIISYLISDPGRSQVLIPVKDSFDHVSHRLMQPIYLGMVVSLVGLLFSILHWEGNTILCMVGSISGLAPLILYSILKGANPTAFFRFTLLRVAVICGPAGYLTLRYFLG